MYARQEIPLPPPNKLKHLREDLQACETPESTDEVPDFDLGNVYAAACSAIASLPGDTYFNKLVRKEVFEANVQEQREHFFQSLRKVHDSSFDVWTLIAHGAFWTEVPIRTEGCLMAGEVVSVGSQESAVVNSWTADFIDNGSLGGLQRHVSRELTPGNAIGKICARYCSIVQSSGTGKSRLLDEFSRDFFLIPVNLRPPNSDGFPPADNQVRDFLLGLGEPSTKNVADSTYSRMTHFLCALFTKVQGTISNLNGGYKAERIGRFRAFMSEGQSMRLAGENRQTFYSEVVAQARLTMEENRNPKSAQDLINALSSLRDALNSESDSTTCTIFAKDPAISVDVFIMFDEAHSLTTPFSDEDLRTKFTELQRALRELREYPLWTFFLSTTGKIAQFSQPHGLDTSSRINWGKLITPGPYIYLGLDQLMESRKINARNTLDDVISMDCVAHMGRPMWGTRYDHGNDEVRNGLVDFAIHKLLGTVEVGKPLSDAQMYAVLSQRLALDIDTPQYLLTSTNPFTLVETMHEQIANHMRICLAVGSGIESLRGVASSEPILSEAAARTMSDADINFNLPLALSSFLSGFCINQGARGELLVAAFFTWARDKVMYPISRPTPTLLCRRFTVKELFDSLFLGSSLDLILKSLPSLCHRNDSPLPFEDVFKEAHMHFNHFIKPYERKIISRQYLVRFMARGAAALGANCQPGFDAVYPYLYKALDLDEEKLGFVIVQVKNDSSFNRTNIGEVFRKMDPFECGLLDKSKTDVLTIPIIRILFLLSSQAVGVEHQKYGQPSNGAVTLDKQMQPCFTSYDFVCSGVDATMLRPVAQFPEAWSALVNKRSDWHDFVDKSEESEILCSELPISGSNDAHFSRWLNDLL